MTNNSATDISVLTSHYKALWQPYVNSHAHATIYHTLEWRDVLHNGLNINHII